MTACGPRHGPRLPAGGVAGLALSRPAARLRGALVCRATAPRVTDPVAAVTAAPCDAHGRRAASGTGARTERVG